jgi:putative DNA primase/helicase
MTGKLCASSSTGKAPPPTKSATGKPQPAGLFHAEPKPWAEQVDGVELLDALVAVFRRYLALPEGAAETLALWVVFTHAVEASAVAPRLAVLSPTPRCGKTTLLALLVHLVRRPLPASNVTPAVIFRVIAREQPTLLIDEADTFVHPGRSELGGIMNSGHTRATAYVWRTEGDNHEPKPFRTFAAIAIAKIGKLPVALQDRSLVIKMQRRRRDERIDRFREDQAAPLGELKRRVIRWVADSRTALSSADPALPEGLNDRAADNWRTLSAIADAAGGHWPETARRVALMISGDEEDTSLSAQLLHDIGDIFSARAGDRISSAELREALCSLDHRPWATLNDGEWIGAHRLASMLEPFGIRPKVLRIGDKTPRGYERAQFEDAWARYPRPQTATPQQAGRINGLDEDQTATQTATGSAEGATGPGSVADRHPDVADDVAPSEAEKYNDIKDVAGVAPPEGEAGPQGRSIDLERLFAASMPEIPKWQAQERRRKARKGKPRPKRP